MNTIKYIMPAIGLLLGSVTTLKAEDSIVNRNVTVEREYKPMIQSAGKINSTPKVLELKADKITPKFSEFNLPLYTDINIHTLPAAEPQRDKRTTLNNGFARVGLGNYFNTLADFAYPLVKTSDIKLDFSLNHLGTFGKKAHSTTGASLDFDKYFRDFDLYAGLGGGHEYLKYYGNRFNGKNKLVNLDTLAATYGIAPYLEQDMAGSYRDAKNFTLKELAKDSSSNRFLRFNAYAGIRSLPMSTGMRYNAELRYDIFDAKNGLAEHLVHTKAGFDTPNNENRIGLDLDMYNSSLKSNLPGAADTAEISTVFVLNPFYSIERANYNVRLGFKSSFSFSKGHPFNPSADIHAEWKAIPKTLSLYGGLTGGYDINSQDKIYSENRYLYSDMRIENTYTPFEFYAGVKVKPAYNVLFDAFMGYRYINNQYFFVNKGYAAPTVAGADSLVYTNRFNVVYSEASLMKIGARIAYNLRDVVNIQLKGAYNGWSVNSQAFAWNKPTWETDLNADVRFTPDFAMSANLFYEGGRHARIGNTAISMKPKMDINLGASYVYNEWITTFVKVNNLINSRYQDFYGYDVQGFNLLIGAALSF